MIPAGKFDWYSPNKTMRPAAASVFNTISALESLPHISSSILELQQLLNSTETDTDVIAKKVKQDPFLAANIMTIANNIKSNRDPHDRKKIDSIDHAITYTGRKVLSDLVLTITLRTLKLNTKIFDAGRYWHESFLIGDIAEFICSHFSLKLSRDQLYISAVLCNVGKLVAAICLPDSIDAVVERVNDPKTLCTWTKAEYTLGAPSHTILGEIGCTLWGLPEYVVSATIGHHDIISKSSNVRNSPAEAAYTMNDVIGFANQMSHWVLLRPSRIDQSILDNFCKTMGLSKSDLEQLASIVAPLAKKTA
jgi:HD-like signal output (HDOD) protein